MKTLLCLLFLSHTAFANDHLSLSANASFHGVAPGFNVSITSPYFKENHAIRLLGAGVLPAIADAYAIYELGYIWGSFVTPRLRYFNQLAAGIRTDVHLNTHLSAGMEYFRQENLSYVVELGGNYAPTAHYGNGIVASLGFKAYLP